MLSTGDLLYLGLIVEVTVYIVCVYLEFTSLAKTVFLPDPHYSQR